MTTVSSLEEKVTGNICQKVAEMWRLNGFKMASVRYHGFLKFKNCSRRGGEATHCAKCKDKKRKRKERSHKKPIHMTSNLRPSTFMVVKVPRRVWSGDHTADHIFVLLLGHMKSRSHDGRWSRVLLSRWLATWLL